RTQNAGGAPTGIRVELAGTFCPFAVPTPTTATPLIPQSVCEGQPVNFSTTAGGIPPFTYVWTLNGNTIQGAIGSIYNIPSVSAADAGIYCVTVTGGCGTAQQCATLVLLSPTPVINCPSAITV